MKDKIVITIWPLPPNGQNLDSCVRKNPELCDALQEYVNHIPEENKDIEIFKIDHNIAYTSHGMVGMYFEKDLKK